LNNPAQGFNLPELIIPAKWLSRFVSSSEHRCNISRVRDT
jgi:hypothetical protein